MKAQKRQIRKPDVQNFKKGDIWYYYNSFVDKRDYGRNDRNQDFITSRPVLILSDNLGAQSSNAIICEISSSTNQAGYIITPNQNEQMVIMPHKVHTINTCYLTHRITSLTSESLKVIMNAFLYHIGESDILPEYYDYTDADIVVEDIPEEAIKKESEDQLKKDVELLEEIESAIPEKSITVVDSGRLDYSKIADGLDWSLLISIDVATRKAFIMNLFNVSHYKACGILTAVLDKKLKMKKLIASKMKLGLELSENEKKLYVTKVDKRF